MHKIKVHAKEVARLRHKLRSMQVGWLPPLLLLLSLPPTSPHNSSTLAVTCNLLPVTKMSGYIAAHVAAVVGRMRCSCLVYWRTIPILLAGYGHEYRRKRDGCRRWSELSCSWQRYRVDIKFGVGTGQMLPDNERPLKMGGRRTSSRMSTMLGYDWRRIEGDFKTNRNGSKTNLKIIQRVECINILWR